MRSGGIIYLDHAATTPVDLAVAREMSESLSLFGNAASTTHVFGRAAAARIEQARAQVAALIGAAPEEIIFTSGATEADNLAILGAVRANAYRGRHVITARTEHKAVLDPCRHLEKEGFTVTYLVPDRAGRIDPEAVRAALREDTVLVSIMHVNNEIGVIQDIEAIGAICRERDILFHTDAAQAVGKVLLDVRYLKVNLLSFTAHKIYGPKGIGALYVHRASRPRLQAVSFGGGQERGLRPGTLPTHQILGFGAACALASERLEADRQRLTSLRDRLWQGLASLGGVHLNGAESPRVAHILNVSFEGVEGESLVTGLKELAVSAGAACSSASGDASYVLRALGRGTVLAQGSLRFSPGRGTTEADIDEAVAAVRREVQRLRALSPASEEAMAAPAGAEAGAGRQVILGEAGSPEKEAWVRFILAVEGQLVKAARAQVWGCPHTMTVAAQLAERLPGRHRDDLVPDDPARWAGLYGVPLERLGRLLTIEDALRDCLQHWT